VPRFTIEVDRTTGHPTLVSGVTRK
jgi:hypothetical protein